MSNLLPNTSIKTRIWIMITLAVVCMATIGGISLYINYNDLLTDRKNKTQGLVTSTYGILEYAYQLEKSDAMSREKAQELAKSIISTMRYDGDNYFWINDMHPKMVMHPLNPKLNGTDLSDYRDPTGKKLFVAFVDAVHKQEAGFVPYLWQKPGFSEPVDKISYVKGFTPWNWVLGSGIYLDDVRTIFWSHAMTELLVLVVAILILVSIAMLLANSITTPLNTMVHTARLVAQGDLTSQITPIRQDELGLLGNAINNMTAELRQMLGDLGIASGDLKDASTELDGIAGGISTRTELMLNRTNRVSENASTMNQDLESVAAATEQTSTNLNTVSVAAQQADSNLQTIAAAAEEANINLGTVAAAAEEASTSMVSVQDAAQRTDRNVDVVVASIQGITASLTEVRSRCEMASKSSQQAAHRAQGSITVMQQLSDSAQEINSVVNVINDIAEQTNMLALNASIEAAGAGEAGKGFAVVANEVKELAAQTGEATKMIMEKIYTMQSHTQEVSSVTTSVTESITQIDLSNQDILYAVGEQERNIEKIATSMEGVATETSEVTRLVGESTEGITEVTRNVTELSQGINEVTRNVTQAATGISEMSRNVVEVSHASSEVAGKVAQAATASANIAESMGDVKETADSINNMSSTITGQSETMAMISMQLTEMLAKFRM